MQTNTKKRLENKNFGGIKPQNLTSAPSYKPATDHPVFVTYFSKKTGDFIIINQQMHNLCIYTVLSHSNIKISYTFRPHGISTSNGLV